LNEFTFQVLLTCFNLACYSNFKSEPFKPAGLLWRRMQVPFVIHAQAVGKA